MNVALRTPSMSREQFLQWVQRQEGRFEFDGRRPVPVTGASRNHGLICHNIYAALRARLKGTGCVVLGPDAGVPTIGRAVRYPDALVTCAAGPGSDLLIAGVVLVIEVLSPTSERTDRIEKVREYFAVPSIRRDVLLEQTSAGATVFEKQEGAAEWTAGVAIAGETLRLPALGIEIPIDELYEGVELASESGEAG